MPSINPQSLVQIVCTGKSGSATGVGFIINKDEESTWILTCRHVVVEGTEAFPEILIEGQYRAKATFPPDSRLDVALLRCEDKALRDRPAVVLKRPHEMKIYTIFTYQQFISEGEPQPPEATVSYYDLSAYSPTTFQLLNKSDVRIERGHSGSPVLDEDQFVIGLVTEVGSFGSSPREGPGDISISVTSVSELLGWPDFPSYLITPRVPAPVQVGAEDLEIATSVQILVAASNDLNDQLALMQETIIRTNLAPSVRAFPVQVYEWGPEIRRLVPRPEPGEDVWSPSIDDFDGYVFLIGLNSARHSVMSRLQDLETKTRASESTQENQPGRRLIYRLVESASPANLTSQLKNFFDELQEERIRFVDCPRQEFPGRFWNDYQVLIGNLVKYQRHPRMARPAPVRSAAPKEITNPYRGLESYLEKHWFLFHGRANEVSDLRDVLASQSHGLIAIIGPSGSGKSSLVRAGLFKRLKLNGIEGSIDWKTLDLTLSQHWDDEGRLLAPLHALARVMLPTPSAEDTSEDKERQEKQAKQLVYDLQFDVTGVVAARLEDQPAAARLLLFVDQFEEIFTGAYTEDQSRNFLASISQLAEHRRVNVIITMRSEFYQPLLGTTLRSLDGAQKPFWLKPADTQSLVDAIYLPAALSGFRFEDNRLAYQIIEDLRPGAGALPLLSYALESLVKTSKGKELTWSAYRKMDGVKGVIQNQINEVAKDVSPDVIGALFRRLVTVDSEGTVGKKPALLDSSWTADVIRLKDQLVEKRLLVVGTSPSPTAPVTIEIAHEALLSNWKELAKWIERSRDALTIMRNVEAAALEWKNELAKASKEQAMAGAASAGAGAVHVQPDANPELQRLKINRERLWTQERLEKVYEALDLLGLSRAGQPIEIQEFLRREAHWLLKELNMPIEHERRAVIGDRLAAVQDPRRGIGLCNGLPDIVWCRVPGGEIQLEGVERRFEVNPFFVSRYVITLRQFDVFTDPETYNKKAWWADLPVDPRSHPAYPQSPATANHPAQYVSWYQAIAFCKWLSEQLHFDIRLPTEWEWAQAATGGNPDYLYPWGPNWDSRRANNREGANRIMTVGMYPDGQSPVGAADMSGNVFEWCLNEYDDPGVLTANTNPRTTRGGAWFSSGDQLSIRYRLRDNANGVNSLNRRLVAGIRLAADSPPPENIFPVEADSET